MICKECNNKQFFARWKDGKLITRVCSKCRNETPVKKESKKTFSFKDENDNNTGEL